MDIKKQEDCKQHMICCNAMIVAFEDIPQMVIVLFVGLLKKFTTLGYISLVVSGVSTLLKITMCSMCKTFVSVTDTGGRHSGQNFGEGSQQMVAYQGNASAPNIAIANTSA